jgi:hypothetical protein
MAFRRNNLRLMVMLPLLAVAPLALAENWVAVGTHSEVDVDSIHKADDGFVHYMDRDPPRTDDATAQRQSYEEAFDCVNKISYVGLDEADWQSKGTAVKPDTHGSSLMDFVCSHVPDTATPPDTAPASEATSDAPPADAPPPEEAPPPQPPAG